MTDFDKGELITMKNGVEYLYNNMNESKKRLQEYQLLIHKIQEIIDDCCEH